MDKVAVDIEEINNGNKNRAHLRDDCIVSMNHTFWLTGCATGVKNESRIISYKV